MVRTPLKAEFRNGNREVWVFLPTDPDPDAGDASTLPAEVTISFRVNSPSKRGEADNKFTVSSRTKDGQFAEIMRETLAAMATQWSQLALR